MAGSVLSTPKTVWPDNSHAVGVGQVDEFVLQNGARASVFGEVRRHHHQAADTLAAAGLDHPGDGFGGHRYASQVDISRDVFDAGEAGHARYMGSGPVDRVHRALETSAHQIADKRCPECGKHR